MHHFRADRCATAFLSTSPPVFVHYSLVTVLMAQEGYRNAIFSTVYRKGILVHFCISNIERTTQNCLVNPRQLEVRRGGRCLAGVGHVTGLAEFVTLMDGGK